MPEENISDIFDRAIQRAIKSQLNERKLPTNEADMRQNFYGVFGRDPIERRRLNGILVLVGNATLIEAGLRDDYVVKGIGTVEDIAIPSSMEEFQKVAMVCAHRIMRTATAANTLNLSAAQMADEFTLERAVNQAIKQQQNLIDEPDLALPKNRFAHVNMGKRGPQQEGDLEALLSAPTKMYAFGIHI